jgi:hypothetical protein
MSTVNPTQPLAELRNNHFHSCHELGLCQNPYSQCSAECAMPALVKLRQPTPLPTLAPGVLDGSYSSDQSKRQRRIYVYMCFSASAMLMGFWGVLAYVIL